MIRRNGVWYGIGALGLLSAVAVEGCASSTDRGTSVDSDSAHKLGDLALGLTLPDGSEVSGVDYVVTKDGVSVRTGTLLVGSDGRASATLTGFDPGTGYQVVLTAPRDGGPACSGQSNTFTVFADMTASVDVILQCDNLTVDGNISINGQFNVCPKVTSSSVSPLTVAVGSVTNISAAGSDRDNDPLSFAWTAPSGTFSAPGAASGTYTCASVGTQTLTVSVSDGPTRGCTRSRTLSVTCVAAGVDSGVDSGIDAGADAGTDAGSADAGVSSSQTAYLVPTLANVLVRPILTAGDSANLKPDGVSPYRMVGIPDGLGAFDNGDGTFTLLSNHEIPTGGIARAHGGAGAFVSKWTIRKNDLRVLHGADLIQSVQLWNKTTSVYAPAANVLFQRFCSADLAAPSAFFDSATSTGFSGQLFLNGEEGGDGRAFAHGLDGVTWELPRLGRQPWENEVASPASGLKTVVIGTDDSSPSGQVFVYVGTKTNTGSAVDRAGLTNGTLYGVKAAGFAAEASAVLPAPSAFTLASLGNVENQTGAQLESATVAAGVTTFLRPEDGAWDPANPNDFYFVSTASFAGNSRLWRLRFTDVKNPELGGQVEAVLDGTEGHKMFDNMTVDPRGHVLLNEDVGGNERLGKVWRYTIATDNLTEIAAADPARFTTGAPGFLTNDEEPSGIIDATSILGAGWFLLDVQAHYSIPGELFEGGQFLAIYDPGSL